ncbi:MAG: hypothetical protein C0594_14715 [Marinilabiliales bacterium]|nr:MAG: hypothetical protein C0594_14715 [Marinilabiliales bacterium]
MVMYASISPDGKYVVVASTDNIVRVWSIEGEVLSELRSHTGIIFHAKFSPDSKRIATCSADKTVCLWDLHGNLLHKMTGHTSQVFSVEFTKAGDGLISTSQEILMWDLNGNLQQKIAHAVSPCTRVNIFPDGKKLLASYFDNKIKVLDFDGHVLTEINTEKLPSEIAITPKGDKIVFTTDEGALFIYSTDGELLYSREGYGGMSLSADGKFIAASRNKPNTIVDLFEFPLFYEDFQKNDWAEPLSNKNKIEYEIVNYNNLLASTDDELLKYALKYYIIDYVRAEDTMKAQEYENMLEGMFRHMVDIGSTPSNFIRYLKLPYLKFLKDSTYNYSEKTNEIYQLIYKTKSTEEMLEIASDLIDYYTVKEADSAAVDKAILLYNKVISKENNSQEYCDRIAEECIWKALILIQRKQPEKTLTLAEYAQSIAPDNEMVRLKLPLLYLLNDRWDMAEKEYRKRINESTKGGERYRDVYMRSIQLFQLSKIVHPDYQKVFELMNEESFDKNDE